MKRIIFIFCLLIISVLHASHTHIDLIHNPALQKEANFYLKYGTIPEIKKMIHKLTALELQNKDAQISLDFSLSQASNAYIQANNRIAEQTKIRDAKIMIPADEYYSLNHEIALAQQDACNAWFSYQSLAATKHLQEKDAIKIDLAQQALMKREIRLMQRRITAQQQAFQEQQRQAYLEKTSKKESSSQEKSQFKKTQENIKPLLNRVFRQAQSVQSAQIPSENLLGQYITQAQEQSGIDAEKKQKKALLKIQKAQENKTLQSLAFQKGISRSVVPTTKERQAQSNKDKESAKEFARQENEQNRMNLEDQASRKAFSFIKPEKVVVNKAMSPEKPQEIIDQNIIDNASMLLSRLQSQQDFNFHPDNQDQDRYFLTTMMELEKFVDENQTLFDNQNLSAIRSQCIQTIEKNISFYRKISQDLKDCAPAEIKKQAHRSAHIAHLKKTYKLDQKLLKALYPFIQEEQTFCNLITQDGSLRSATKISELLQAKLKGSEAKTSSIQSYINDTSLKALAKDSPFLYTINQSETDNEEKTNKSTGTPKVDNYTRNKILELTSPTAHEQAKKELIAVISAKIKSIFPTYNPDQIEKRALFIITQGTKEFKTFEANAPQFDTLEAAMEYAKNNHIDNICLRTVLLNKNNNLSETEISILGQLECIVFESHFSYYCSNIIKPQTSLATKK